MNATDLTATLVRLGLSQADLRRIIERLSGEEISNVTVNRWANGRTGIPASAASTVRLLEMMPAGKRAKLARKD